MKMSLKYLFLVLTVILLYLSRRCQSISFNLDPDSKKCIREEVHKDVLVVGQYDLEDIASQRTNIEVRHVTASCITRDGQL